jgi:hypothetical protein
MSSDLWAMGTERLSLTEKRTQKLEKHQTENCVVRGLNNIKDIFSPGVTVKDFESYLKTGPNCRRVALGSKTVP